MSALPTFALLLALALGAATPSTAADPAVARPSFEIKGHTLTQGTVFFIAADTRAGAVAVGTAHAFDLRELVRVERGQLLLGNSRRVAATTRGFLIPPGRPFNAPGATLLDDYVAYSLDAPPIGVSLLTLSNGAVVRGARVQVLGVPAGSAHDVDDVFGRIIEVSTTRPKRSSSSCALPAGTPSTCTRAPRSTAPFESVSRLTPIGGASRLYAT